jgi:hypothetical protein
VKKVSADFMNNSGKLEVEMVILVRGGEIFSPDPLGEKDILILDSKIGAICEPGQIRIAGFPIDEVDASGKRIFPGFIDSHAHILGGGGEGGASTRAPEITVEDIITNGVTTVISCLGTDGTTRHMESLLAKANGLEVSCGRNAGRKSGYIPLPSGRWEPPPRDVFPVDRRNRDPDHTAHSHSLQP